MRRRTYRWLAALPGLGILVGVPFANRVHTYVFGLPFLLAWILLCVLLTSALMALIQEWDRRRDAEEARSRFG
jgi:4-hydroxybenzoate polyprenyltransferase